MGRGEVDAQGPVHAVRERDPGTTVTYNTLGVARLRFRMRGDKSGRVKSPPLLRRGTGEAPRVAVLDATPCRCPANATTAPAHFGHRICRWGSSSPAMNGPLVLRYGVQPQDVARNRSATPCSGTSRDHLRIIWCGATSGWCIVHLAACMQTDTGTYCQPVIPMRPCIPVKVPEAGDAIIVEPSFSFTLIAAAATHNKTEEAISG